MDTGAKPGARTIMLYSEYGWVTPGFSVYSKGGAGSSTDSVCPFESVCMDSSVDSGSPVMEISAVAPSMGLPSWSVTSTLKDPVSGMF